jgi:hypothetical protein
MKFSDILKNRFISILWKSTTKDFGSWSEQSVSNGALLE